MKKDFPIEIGEKTYQLRLNYDALTFVEDRTGKSFIEVTQQGTMTSMKLLFTAMLRKNHPEILPESINELLDETDMTQLSAVIAEAITNYFNKGKKAVEVTSKKKSGPASSKTTDDLTGAV